MAADGSRVQQLTYSYDDTQATLPGGSVPAFTPDSARLLYLKGKNIVARRLNSPAETVLATPFSKSGTANMMPRCTRDGMVFFCQQMREGAQPQLCRMQLDGSNYRLLTAGAFPQFSADGSIVAYTSASDPATPTVHVMHADGSHDRLVAPGFLDALSADGTMVASTKLVPAKGENMKPAMWWASTSRRARRSGRCPRRGNRVFDPLDLFTLDFSPDGRHLVDAASGGLLLTDAEGKNQQRISLGNDSFPKYTPDGRKIAFLREVQQDDLLIHQLILMDADGKNAWMLAEGISGEGFTISPDGAEIAVYGYAVPPAAPTPPFTFNAPTKPPRRQGADTGRDRRRETSRHANGAHQHQRGTITVELYGKEAPKTVANFVKLVKSHFYDGLTFHRVVPNFIVQGGDPAGNGTGDAGYKIKLEIAPSLTHVEGALAMARFPNDPNSAGHRVLHHPECAAQAGQAVCGLRQSHQRHGCGEETTERR